MALATTTLSSAVTVNDNSIIVASATSLAAGRLILIDGEMLKVAQNYVLASTTVPVLRGQDGTVTAAHASGANVTHGLASDFATPGAGNATTYPVAGRSQSITSYSTTGAIALPSAGQDAIAVLNGTTALAMTIADPTKDMDGSRLTIISNGVAAHTLTFASGLSGGSSNYDVVTINATAPIAMETIACNGLWMSLIQPPMAGTMTNITGTLA